MPVTKWLILECKHTKKVSNNTSVWVGSLVRCNSCKNLSKVILIRA